MYASTPGLYDAESPADPPPTRSPLSLGVNFEGDSPSSASPLSSPSLRRLFRWASATHSYCLR